MEENIYNQFSTFEELGIIPPILQAIEEMGYVQPMPIQAQVIPVILGNTDEGTARDVVGLAQTGTGKTAAFGLPLLQSVVVSDRTPQALVLAPTRELCLQIAGDLQDYAKYIRHMSILPVYGGSSIGSQIGALKRGVHVVVATPGRLIDLINRGAVSLDNINTLVLDEADEMLSMGFQEDIETILAGIPDNHRTMLFSATMPKQIAGIAQNYMNNPVEITIGHKNEGSANVSHRYCLVHAKDKYAALKRIVDYYPNIYGIIFCRTRKETQDIAAQLMADGYNADALHGDLSQAQRDTVMNKFRIRNLRLLVATDVAARGLDVDDLTHVINYGLPDDIEVYTHRSGRTGRAGKRGTSICIIHIKERRRLAEIERVISKEFEKALVPTAVQITEKQLFNLADRLEKVEVKEEEIAQLLDPIYKKLSWLSTEDLIKRIVSLEFNRMIEYYKDSADLDIPEERRSREKKNKRGEQPKGHPDNGQGQHWAEPGMTRIFINLGKRDGVRPKDIITLMNAHVHHRIEMGRIDLLTNFSFFEVPEREARFVIKDMDGADFKGRRVSVSIAGSDASPNYSKKTPKRGPQPYGRKSNFGGNPFEEPEYVGSTRRNKKSRNDYPTDETYKAKGGKGDNDRKKRKKY